MPIPYLGGSGREPTWHRRKKREESVGKLGTLEGNSPALNPALFLPNSLASGKFPVLLECFIICKMSRVLPNLKVCCENEILNRP